MGTLAFSIGINAYISIHLGKINKSDTNLKCIYFPSTGTAVMSIFPNVYVSMVMISTMGIISMSISYCPYALLGQYHEMKEVQTNST